MDHQRYAIYYAPRPAALAQATAAWLGWDCQSGRNAAPLPGMPEVPPEVTAAPRKYGFHGTLKAPFRLRQDLTPADLDRAVADLARRLPWLELPGLTLHRLDGFLALVPEGGDGALARLAAEVVQALDSFRAPLTQAEIDRRSPDRLTERQREHLLRWGYPYVMEDFRFHLTLTGDLPPDRAEEVAKLLSPWLLPLLPRPFVVEDLCLFGEAQDGRFHLLSRHALTG